MTHQAELARIYPREILAIAEVRAGAGGAEEISGVLHNLSVADALGQLHRFGDVEHCAGFMAWVRLRPQRLLEVVRAQQRIFQLEDNMPDAPVVFVMEQLNAPPDPRELTRRMRWLAAVNGVELIAGWRGERLRMRRVRSHGFFGRQ